MPTPSALDCIAASIHNLAQAIQEPTTSSPLSPLSTSQLAALNDLVTLFTPSTPDDDLAPNVDTTPDTDAPRLRATSAPTLGLTAPSDIPPVTSPTLVSDAIATSEEHQLPAAVPAPPIASTPSTTVMPAAVPSIPKASPSRRSNRKRRKPQRLRTTSTPQANTAAHTGTSVTDGTEYWALHGTAINPDTGLVAEYYELSRSSDGAQWIHSNVEEFGRLVQGLGPDSDMPHGTNTIYFIHPDQMPKDRTAAYIRVVCADRPEKPNPKRVRITIGGDRIDYPGNTSTKTADMTTVKTLINSTISTRHARVMTGDVKDFYLGTPLDRYEYIRIALTFIPQTIIDLYNLTAIAVNGYVWAEVQKGMYGLPQAGILANQLLQRLLEPHGYRPVPITPGIWRHDIRDLHFALVVDDFGVKYTKRDDAEHLMQTLVTSVTK